MAVPAPFAASQTIEQAMVGDSQAVFLVNQQDGFSWEPLEFDVTVLRAHVQHEGMSIGAQYCSWHPTAPLLAVSSDGLFATFVFNAATKQQVFRVEGHARPCLGVMFAPFDPSLLVYNEETKHVFVREWRCGEGAYTRSAAEDFAEHPAAGMQLLRVPLVQQEVGPGSVLPFNSRRRRITGMAASGQGDLLVSTKQGAVFRYFAALPWTPARHQLWPLRFRQAARELLLCAHRRPHGGGGGGGGGSSAGGGGGGGQEGSRTGLWALPVPVVLHVIEALAGRRAEWLAEEQEQ